ncbi:MAG: glycosyltransferase family A protein [Cyanobacteriota bacterium]
MTTYNRGNYLNRCIDSVLAQSFKDFELIIVDDGSNDNSFEIVKKYINNNENIRYIYHSNRKVSLSKNVGINSACGKYIAFIDSDDEYKNDYLLKRVEYMLENPDIDLIDGGSIVIGDPYVTDKNNLTQKIHIHECFLGATIFAKKDVFLSLGGFDKSLSYAEDSAFMEKAKITYNVEKLNYPSYVYYRDTPDSITNTIAHINEKI